MSTAPGVSVASPRKGTRRIILAGIVLVMGALTYAISPVRHLRAAGTLLRIQDSAAKSFIARFETYRVEEREVSVTGDGIVLRARQYAPAGLNNPPGIVVLHGVHHLGMNEPRLVRFARALAGSGLAVLTPELPAIADYRIDTSTVPQVGVSAQQFSRALGVPRVGVLGLSFTGGLALMAAADSRYSDSIAYIVSVGAHDDLARVTQFFVTSRSPRPDGSVEQLQAHEYGVLVTILNNADDFFAPADIAGASEALHLWLWEKPDEARARMKSLSPAAQQTLQLLFDGKRESFGPLLLAETTKRSGRMAEVSPHGRLASLHVPVMLLHGAGDDVIPASELLWLEQEIPQQDLRAALISPAISHVEFGGKPSIRDNFELVHWMEAFLAISEDSPKGHVPHW